MTLRTSIAAATACAALATAFAAVSARAGGDLVTFPENYAAGVLYTTVDRADNKQYRELYATPRRRSRPRRKASRCRAAPC